MLLCVLHPSHHTRIQSINVIPALRASIDRKQDNTHILLIIPCDKRMIMLDTIQ